MADPRLISEAGVSAKKSGYIYRVVQNANAISAAMQNLSELYQEGVLLGFGTSIQDADFVGDNDHVDRTWLLSLLAPNGTAAAINALLDANSGAHRTVLLKAKRG